MEQFILHATVNKDGTVSFSTLLTHEAVVCQGRAVPCVIHHPSDHRMRGWRLHWRDDIQLMERVCPHQIGHPDPDQLAWEQFTGYSTGRVHGCDGCCHKSGCTCPACERWAPPVTPYYGKRIKDGY